MFTDQVEYEVHPIGYQGPDARRLTYQLRSQFARGHQARVEHSEDVIKDTIARVPKTSWDHMKKILIDWDPSLRFGWLIPQYIEIKSRVKVTTTNTYYNVVPVAVNHSDQRIYAHQFRDRYRWGDGDDLALNWLNAEPPTMDEVKTAKAKRWEVMTGRQGAWLMATGGPNNG